MLRMLLQVSGYMLQVFNVEAQSPIAGLPET
jgi:hypothetical protein